MAVPEQKLKWPSWHNQSGWCRTIPYQSGDSVRLFPGGSVITLAGVDDDILAAFDPQVYRVEQAIGHQRLRPVRDVVLMPQLIGDVLERLLQFLHFERKKRPPAGFTGEVPQDFVAIAFL